MRVLNALGRPMKPSEIIFGKDGKPIILDAPTQRKIDKMQRSMNEFHEWNSVQNAIGMDVAITTMTTIVRKVSEQKFRTIYKPMPDYFPILVGNGAWSDVLLTYRDYSIGDAFETGITNMSQNNSRIPQVDSGVDTIPQAVYTWNKGIGWTIPQLEMAAKAGNWDRVASLQRSLKKNWDLGIEKIGFVGANQLNGNSGKVYGLLNQPGVTVNSTVITALISSLDATGLANLVANMVQAYQANNNYTAYPTHFIIPQDDWNGMAKQSSPTFPIATQIKVLTDAFKDVCPNFQAILPTYYAQPANSFGVLSKHTYTLLNYDDESVKMDIPVPFTSTVPNSLNNYQIQSVSYGQFTGVVVPRPAEMLYFANPNG